MIRAKYVEVLESGIIGALLVPTTMILLYAGAEAIDSAAGMPADHYTLIFQVWAFAMLPLIAALVGASSAWLSMKYGPGLLEISALSAISGVIAILGGALLFFFVSAFLSPPDAGSQLVDRLPYFIDPLASLISDPVALSAMALYVLISIACGLLYSKLMPKSAAATNAQ